LKTVRFSQIVAAAGRPRAHTLWVAPDRDPEFKRARAAHRVMTIAHLAGRTDAGIVGFDPKQGASEFLIFPKSLKAFEGARVVGVKFDLVEQPKLGVAKAGAWKGPAPRKGATKKAKPAKLFVFPSAKQRTEPKSETGKAEIAEAKKPEPKPAPKPPPAPESRPEPDAAHLVREIRSALKELEAGKSVAAYRRLENALR
jgi:hypothetical protein